tara:strand:- start:299 stop:463 length:165 start_codon:yes stop_codon:yes gene_type:complete
MQDMSYSAPPPETRPCSHCGKELSLNFFGLDQYFCKKCEANTNADNVKSFEKEA